MKRKEQESYNDCSWQDAVISWEGTEVLLIPPHSCFLPSLLPNCTHNKTLSFIAAVYCHVIPYYLALPFLVDRRRQDLLETKTTAPRKCEKGQLYIPDFQLI